MGHSADDIRSVNSGENFIQHYGVKGMKWGVRRSAKQLASARSERKAAKKKIKSEPSSEEAKVARDKLKRKGTQLSNKEIQDTVRRMQLEGQYSQLKPSTVKKGQKAVKATIGAATTAATVYNLAKSPAGKALTNKIKEASGS